MGVTVCERPGCENLLTARQRQYCGAACKQWAYRQRQQAAVAATEALAYTAPKTIADVVADFAAEHCKVTSGERIDEPVIVPAWQRQFLEAAFRPGIREAALCVARKNAKTSLIALLLAVHLVADEDALRRPARWRALAASIDGETIGELRELMLAFLQQAGERYADRWEYKAWPSPGRVLGHHGREVRFVNFGTAKGAAVGCDVVILDECGLLEERHRPMWRLLYSSLVQRRGRLLAIGAKYECAMYRELRDRADEPAVHWTEYAAPDDVDINDGDAVEAGLRAANPGIDDGILTIEGLLEAWHRAKSNPTDETGFRGDHLNAPADVTRELVVSLADWKACANREPAERRGPCVIGVDAGGSSSMTCATALWPASGRIEAYAGLPATPALAERERADGVAPGTYQAMIDEGAMRLYRGRVTPVGEFIKDVGARLRGQRVTLWGGDRYRRAELVDAMRRARVRWPTHSKHSFRGQGAGSKADGSRDIRAFIDLVLQRRLSVGAGKVLLHNAIASSSLRYDGAGNPALVKANRGSRIDALQSAVIGAGLAAVVGERRGAVVRGGLIHPE